MKKTILTVSLMITILLTLAGCGSSSSVTANSSSVKISLSISARDQFLTSLETAIKDKASEKGIDVSVFDAESDITRQMSHVQTAATNGTDVMIVNIVDTDTAEEIIDAAGDMKLVFVNRAIDESLLKEGQITFVGSDEEEAGKLQGEYLADYFTEKGQDEVNIVILTGTLGMQATTKRTESAKQALEDSGLTINYVYEDAALWDKATAMDMFTQFLGSNKPYDAVICNNDEMALGVIEAMKTIGDGTITVPVCGIDATQVALESMEAGELAFTVFQDAKGQGEGAFESAYALATGESTDLTVMIPFEPVTQDNYKDYL